MNEKERTRREMSVGLEAAILVAGGVSKLAEGARVRSQAIAYWKKKGIPPRRVRTVSRLTGIPCHVLRPDLYDPPAQGNAA